jgi:hypothetical protein
MVNTVFSCVLVTIGGKKGKQKDLFEYLGGL